MSLPFVMLWHRLGAYDDSASGITHLKWNPEWATWKTHAHFVCNRESIHGSGTAIVSNSISNNSSSLPSLVIGWDLNAGLVAFV